MFKTETILVSKHQFQINKREIPQKLSNFHLSEVVSLQPMSTYVQFQLPLVNSGIIYMFLFAR